MSFAKSVIRHCGYPLAGVVMLLLVGAGCGNWPAPAPRPEVSQQAVTLTARGTPAPRRGGRMTVGVTREPATLNPAFAAPAAVTVMRPVVEGLIDFDAAGRPRPWLAEEVPTPANGGVSSDGRVVTFKLRQGVAWEDGRPFTAEDILFTFAAYRNPDNPFPAETVAVYQQLRAVDALDAYTVRLTYERSEATYLRAFSPIFPAHLFNGLTRLADHPYSRAPLGTGPFRVHEWVPGDHLTLARSPSYRERGRPYLDEIAFRFFDDAAAAAAAFRAGGIDLLLDPDPEQTGLAAARATVRGLAPARRVPPTWNTQEWWREP